MTTDTATTAALPPETAARLATFARACKGAARAVSLYPPEHPAIEVALARLAAAGVAAADRRPFSMLVSPDNLLVEGRACARPESAIADLAALLHSHLVGQLTVSRRADAASWRLFLGLLARNPMEIRSQGGISRAWTTTGGVGLEIQEIDYATIIEEREAGEAASWEAIVANCLRVDALDLDDETLRALAEIAKDATRLGDLVARLEEQSSGSLDGRGRAAAIARVLTALQRHVAKEQPASLDAVLNNMASAATRLSPDLLLELLAAIRQPDSVAAPLTDVFRRITDPMISRLVSRSIISERGCTIRLTEVFRALAPDPERQRTIAGLARGQVLDSPFGAEAGFEQLWSRVEELLFSYSDKPFVPEAYNLELSSARAHSLEIEHVPDDPPARIAAWLTSVSDAHLRSLDLQLLLDLLEVEQDGGRWHDVLDLIVAQVDDLLLVGDLAGARRLTEALTGAARRGRPPVAPAPPSPAPAAHADERAREAARAVENLVAGSMVSVLAGHLNTVADEEVEHVKGLCAAVGPSLIPRLADALSAEGRARSRQRLTQLLMMFGEEGRQSVDKLRRSSSASVRRTAVQILRTFGGDEAVRDLAQMLEDPETSVQREAVRALIGLGSADAHAILQETLGSQDSPARAAVFQELTTTRDENATPLFCYIVKHGVCRGTLREIYLKSVSRLGAVGGRDGLETLREVLNRGNIWAPRRTREVRIAAATALAAMKDGAGRGVLEEAAAQGAFGVRRVAKRLLGELAVNR
jgi:hypothetical protein